MGKKLDALLGRNFKTSKFKAIVSLAISRLSILKNQRQARLSVARSDLVQILNLGHHERALLRVEQVIKEQNMLDVLVMIEGFCLLLIERINLLAHERECPDELKEAVSSLIYATTRCGEFPELQEIRSFFTSRYGKEFTARAIQLRNNCGVNPKMIQKLSTRQPSLENRVMVLKEIALQNNITLQIEEPSDEIKEEKLEINQNENQPKPEPPVDTSQVLAIEIKEVNYGLSDATVGRKKYRDVADAAQAAFESAAYAAVAARAAVELCRSAPHDDPGDRNSAPSPTRIESVTTREQLEFEIRTDEEERDRMRIEDRSVELEIEKIPEKIDNVVAISTELGFDETENKCDEEIPPLMVSRDLVIDAKASGLSEDETMSCEKSSDAGDDLEEGRGEGFHGFSQKQFPLRSQDGLKAKKMERPVSVRTRRAPVR